MKRRSVIMGGAATAAALGAAGLPRAQNVVADPWGQRRRFAETPFGRIAYAEVGQGPVAIFLHGWPLHGFHWRDVMARLADIRRCIAPDFMGLGHTDAPANADLSPARQAEMILDLMNRLNIDRADLVSNDSGTTVAQILAARAPDRVRSLLLTNGDVHTNSPPDGLKPAIEAARAGLLVTLFDRHLLEPGFGASREGLGGLAYSDPAFFTDALAAIYLSPITATPVRRRQCQDYGVAFEPNPLPALEAKLRTCTVPARIVWGSRDRLFPVLWAHWLDAALPQSRGVRIIEGANLFFPEECPAPIADEARRLWDAG